MDIGLGLGNLALLKCGDGEQVDQVFGNVGQGGDFADRFSLRSASADGAVVVLELDPVAGAYVLSDLSTGPVLFATC